MRWVDVAAAPGAGKSTLCYRNDDGSEWWGDRSITWDGKPPPAYWRLYLDEITTLMGLVQDHPSHTAVLRMNDRSAKKMATVERMQDDRTFVQTGWVQRILGFGWRLHDMKRDVNLIRSALWRMPVSVGVAFLEASPECIKERNRARRLNPATAHEDRSFQVDHMLPAIEIAKEVLNERGVPVIGIDVEHQPIEAARAQLRAFAGQGLSDPAQMGPRDQEPAFCPFPAWWRR